MRLSGSPMLVTGLAEQAPRPKRIGSLTLPLASFGDPLIAGVRPDISEFKPLKVVVRGWQCYFV